MNRLDRYLFLQLLGPFGFFTLALTGILWLAQTLPLMEIIIDNGQSGFIFLEFSTLILPNVLVIVLPLAAFAATLFTINRMFDESEMVVILSAGVRPYRIIRPVLAFAIFVMTAMSVLIYVLQPLATTQLGERLFEVKQDALGSLLREKQFMHPAKGITIFIEKSSKAGEIENLFLHDQRDNLLPVTYSAEKALLLQDGDELRLIMSEGIMQRYSVPDETLNIVEFEQFVFDLTDIINKRSKRRRSPIEYSVSELLTPEDIIADGGRRSSATYLAEGHQKAALPLLGLALPIFAFGMLMSASYRRSGMGLRIAITSALGIFIVGTTLMIKTFVISNPTMFLLSYAPPLACLVIALLLLSQSRIQRTFGRISVRS